MPFTMSDAAVFDGLVPLAQGAVKMFAQQSPVMDRIPWESIDGNAFRYRREQALGSAAWRAVGQGITESTANLAVYTENLFILSGQFSFDTFIEATSGKGAAGIDVKSQQFASKAQAMATAFDQAFFEGDPSTDSNTLVGMRTRLTGSQVICPVTSNQSTGSQLTLAAIDKLLDLVPFSDKCLYMHRDTKRKIYSLVQAQTGSFQIQVGQDDYGRKADFYSGVPIYVVEEQGTATSILGWDEDAGNGTSNTGSAYCISYGLDRVHGIYGGGKIVDLRDFGEQQAAPTVMGRLEAYVGLVQRHPRASARLRAITQP